MDVSDQLHAPAALLPGKEPRYSSVRWFVDKTDKIRY